MGAKQRCASCVVHPIHWNSRGVHKAASAGDRPTSSSPVKTSEHPWTSSAGKFLVVLQRISTQESHPTRTSLSISVATLSPPSPHLAISKPQRPCYKNPRLCHDPVYFPSCVYWAETGRYTRIHGALFSLSAPYFLFMVNSGVPASLPNEELGLIWSH